MHKDLLVVHPHKHHLLHLAAGAAAARNDMAYVTPFYQTGVGRCAGLLPGRVGAKARGYAHPALQSDQVIAPFVWQLRRLMAFATGQEIAGQFDEWVARRISNRDWTARVVVTAQDYMPLTSRAAKSAGAKLMSDQISNQSDEAMARIATHSREWDGKATDHDESINTGLLGLADHAFAPSCYTVDGIKHRLNPNAQLHVVPYGVDVERFSPAVRTEGAANEICIVARANSVRKGAHLLLKALYQTAGSLFALASHRTIRVCIIGRMEPRLQPLLQETQSAVVGKLVIDCRNHAHEDMPGVLGGASLFVMPSLSESMSLMALEAASCQVPLIVTPYCGLDDFENGRHGMMIDDSVTSLAQTLVDAFHRRREWPRWGEEARAMASRFSWCRYEHQIADVFRHV